MPQLPTGTVTFLFTDIEGSTLRWERQREAMAIALERHNAILQRAITSRGGQVFKTVGDAFCAAFGDAISALEVAIEAQRALDLERWDEIAHDFEPLRVRMGVHTGLVELQDEDYFGRPVNRVARLMSAGHGGQVLVSLATQQLVRDALPAGAELEDLGVHRLKDLEHSEHIYRLVVPGLPEVDRAPDTAERLSAGDNAVPEGFVEDAACPYRGLHAFREEDAPFFFGREAFTELLVRALGRAPMVGVVGPSGSGKSSVVLAGLLPRLRGTDAANIGGEPKARVANDAAGPVWNVLEIRPGARPFHALAAGLVPLLEGDGLSEADRLVETSKVARYLSEGTLRPSELIARIFDKQPGFERLLLVVDQFEELYTLCPDRGLQRAFQDRLFEAAFEQDADARLRLALTLRADFMGHALAYRPFADAIQQHDVKLGPMNREELARVIAEPAKRQGRAFESGLVERILDDVGEEAGTLPLLEFALTKLWEQQEAGWLTHAAYEDIGRVEGAVARHADAVLERLPEAEREEARKVIVQMVRPGEGTEDTRRVAHKDELGEGSWSLVQTLADARLVVTNRDEAGRETAEVVHEALIRTWGRLKDWMGEDRRFRMWQERLRFGIKQWEQAERDEGALLRGVPLAEAEQWLAERGEEMTAGEVDYVRAAAALRESRLEATRVQAERERLLEARGRKLLRMVAGISTAAAMVGLVLAGLAWNASRSEARQAEIARSQGLAVQAERLLDGGAVDKALALALEAASIPDPPEELTRSLTRVAFEPGTRYLLGPHPQPVHELATSPDGHLLYAGMAPQSVQKPVSGDLAIRIWDLRTGTLSGQLEDGGNRVTGLDVSPDGRWVVAADVSRSEVLSWDAASGRLVQRWSGVSPAAEDVAVLADSRHVAAGPSLIDIETGQIVSRLHTAFSGQARVALHRTGDLLALRTATQIGVYSLDDLTPRWAVDDASAPLLDFTADGSEVVVAASGQVARRDAATGEEIASFQIPSETYVQSLAVDPYGDYVALGARTGLIHLYDLETGQLGSTLRGHTGNVMALLFSLDGRQLYSSAEDRTLRVWDLMRGDVLASLRSPTGPAEMAWTHDGSRLVSRETVSDTVRLRVLELSTPLEPAAASAVEVVAESRGAASAIPWDDVQLAGNPETPSRQFAITGDGRRLALADAYSITEYDLTSLETIRRDEKAHGGRWIEGLRYGPDDSVLYSDGYGGSFRRWNATDPRGTQLAAIGEPAYGLALNGDGTRAAALGLYSRDVVVVELDGSGSYRRLAHPNNGDSLAFSPDDRLLLSGGRAGIGLIREVESGELVHELVGHTGEIVFVDFSPDGSLALTSGVDETVRVWTVEDGSERYVVPGGFDAVFRSDSQAVLARSPDQRAIVEYYIGAQLDDVLGWIDGNRYVPRLGCGEWRRFGLEDACAQAGARSQSTPASWRSWLMRPQSTPARPTPTASRLASTPATPGVVRAARAGQQTGHLPLGGSEAWTVDLEAGAGLVVTMRRRSLPVEGSVGNELDPSLILRGPDGKVLTRAEDRAFDDPDAELLLDEAPLAGSYTIETRSHRDQSAGDYVLDVSTPRWQLPAGAYHAQSVDLSPDASSLLVGSWATARVLDGETGEELLRLDGQQQWIHDVRFDGSGERAATASRDGSILLWDARSGEMLRRFELTGGHPTAVGFTLDDASLVAGTSDGSVFVWDLASGQELAHWAGHSEVVEDLAVHPDGRRLVTVGADGRLVVHDLQAGRVQEEWTLADGALGSVDLDPTGRLALVTSSSWVPDEAPIRLWDLDRGAPAGRFDGHEDLVRDARFAKEGQAIVSASADGTIRVWDAGTGDVLARRLAHFGGGVQAVAVADDEGFVISVGTEPNAKRWDFTVGLVGDTDP